MKVNQVYSSVSGLQKYRILGVHGDTVVYEVSNSLGVQGLGGTNIHDFKSFAPVLVEG